MDKSAVDVPSLSKPTICITLVCGCDSTAASHSSLTELSLSRDCKKLSLLVRMLAVSACCPEMSPGGCLVEQLA